VFTTSDHEAILLTVGGPPCHSQPMTGPRKAYRQDPLRPQTFASALEVLAVSLVAVAMEVAADSQFEQWMSGSQWRASHKTEA